jgi:hypothetical protein
MLEVRLCSDVHNGSNAPLVLFSKLTIGLKVVVQSRISKDTIRVVWDLGMNVEDKEENRRARILRSSVGVATPVLFSGTRQVPPAMSVQPQSSLILSLFGAIELTLEHNEKLQDIKRAMLY